MQLVQIFFHPWSFVCTCWELSRNLRATRPSVPSGPIVGRHSSLATKCFLFGEDLITFGASISACENDGRWEVACLLMAELEENNLQSDLITSNAPRT